MLPFLRSKVFFLLFLCFFPLFFDPCRETFLCPKVFFPLVFCFVFVFVSFFRTPAVKLKKQFYLCLYLLAHLHKVKFIENVAAHNR